MTNIRHFKKDERKRILIDKPVQLTCMLYAVVILLLVFSFVFANFYLSIWGGVVNALADPKVRNDLLAVGTQEPQTTFQEEKGKLTFLFFGDAEKLTRKQREVLLAIMHETNGKLLWAFSFVIIFTAWVSVYLTHRIVGPYYRIHADLKAVDQKDLTTRIRIRRKDVGKSVVRDLNHTIAGFDVAITMLKKVIREYEFKPQQLVTRLKEELSHFKTSS